ncbi:MAG: ABC transporter substrate binding protein [Pseudomonadota bacterium]
MQQGMFTATRRIKGILGLIALLILTPAAANGAEKLIIIKSSDNSYYNQTIQTLMNRLDRAIQVSIVDAANPGINLSNDYQNALVIALGMPAVKMAEKSGSVIPQINAYLTHEQYRQKKSGDSFTLVLDQHPKRYLAFSQFLFQPDSLGLITEKSNPLVANGDELTRDLSVELNTYLVDKNNKLLPVLRKLLKKDDGLLMLPQRALYNRDSLKGVLLTSYRFRKPVISYSPAHVKAGALASIYSSPIDIGRHLGEIVNQHLSEKNKLEKGFVYARYYSITTNRKVAKALGIKIPERSYLLQKLSEVKP